MHFQPRNLYEFIKWVVNRWINNMATIQGMREKKRAVDLNSSPRSCISLSWRRRVKIFWELVCFRDEVNGVISQNTLFFSRRRQLRGNKIDIQWKELPNKILQPSPKDAVIYMSMPKCHILLKRTSTTLCVTYARGILSARPDHIKYTLSYATQQQLASTLYQFCKS